MLRRNMVVGVVAMTALMSALALTPAHAATAAVSCSGRGCDGKDPVSSGCSSTAITAEDREIITSDGRGVTGVIQLRYSTACRTVWARIINSFTPSNSNAEGSVFRNSDSNVESCLHLTYSSSLGNYSCYTAMLYDGGVTSYAVGTIDLINGPNSYGRTPSY